MRKLLFVIALLCAPSAFAQGQRQPTMALSPAGRPLAGAIVYVCTGDQTGSINYSATPPCSPEATIYSDPLLTDPITQPLLTNQGNYSYYGPAEVVTEVVQAQAGVTGYAATINLGIGLAPNTANTFTAAQTFKNANGVLNAATFSGSDINAQFNTAVAALPTLGGYAVGQVMIPAGQYSAATKAVFASPYLTVYAYGVTITCTLNDNCWDIHTNPFTIAPGAGVYGPLTIIGPGGTYSNISGVHLGDVIGGHFQFIIDNYTGTGDACLWLDNINGFAERNFFDVELGIHADVQDGCTKNVKVTNSSDPHSSTDDSFSFNSWNLRMSLTGSGAIGMSVESGALTGNFIEGSANAGSSTTIFSFTTTIASLPNDFHFKIDSGSGTGITRFYVAGGSSCSYTGEVITTSFANVTDNGTCNYQIGDENGGGGFENIPAANGLLLSNLAQLAPNTGNTTSGVTGTLMGIANKGVGWLYQMDTSGDVGIAGAMHATGFVGGGTVIPASLTTTAATSDNVTVTGMTSSGHCSLTPTNASADSLLTGTYVSAKTTDQITVTHANTSGATFDVMCTPN